MEILQNAIDNKIINDTLQHIYVDSENFFATNTKVLVVKKHNLTIEKSFAIVNLKAKDKISFEGIENLDEAQYIANYSIKCFDYKKVIPKGEKNFEFSNHDGFEMLQLISAKHNIIVPFLQNVEFFNALKHITFDWYVYNDYNLPFMIGNDIYTIVIMPINYDIQKTFDYQKGVKDGTSKN